MTRCWRHSVFVNKTGLYLPGRLGEVRPLIVYNVWPEYVSAERERSISRSVLKPIFMTSALRSAASRCTLRSPLRCRSPRFLPAPLHFRSAQRSHALDARSLNFLSVILLAFRFNYRRRATLCVARFLPSRVVRPSVCPSHAVIISKRINLS